MAYQLVQCGVCCGKRKILDYMGKLNVCYLCDGKGWCETDNSPHISENKGHNAAVERAKEIIDGECDFSHFSAWAEPLAEENTKAPNELEPIAQAENKFDGRSDWLKAFGLPFPANEFIAAADGVVVSGGSVEGERFSPAPQSELEKPLKKRGRPKKNGDINGAA